MAISNQKFSTFVDGGELAEDDIVVGLRSGVNTRFTFNGYLPPGVVVPVDQGGTGATTASGARTNLGLEIGSDVEAWSASLDALAALGGTGYITQTGANTFTNRLMAGTANQIDIANGNGVAANTTFAISSTLNLPGTFNIQSSTAINSIIDDDSMATASATNISTSEAIKAYVDATAAGVVNSVSGTANEVDVDNTDPANPIVGLSSTIDTPGTFTIQGTTAITAINNNTALAGASATTMSTDGAIKTYIDNQSTPPGGSDTQIQYNNAGAFGGISGFTTNGTDTVNLVGQLNVDNLRLDGTTISSESTNADINFVPDGTGNSVFTNNLVISDTDGILDENENEQLLFSTTASAVNYLQIANAATGDGPTLSVQGETNTDLNIVAAGTGNVLFNGSDVICGDPGTEASGIDVNGTTYNSVLKASDIGGTNAAQFILHRHSTSLQSLILGARSNSNTSAHAAVTNGQSLMTIYGAGWTDTHYDLFGAIDISADSSGTIGATSAPGRIRLQVTADSAQAPTTALTISNDKSALFAGDVTVGTGSQTLTLNSSTAVDGVIDDDSFATASATTLATSESIKAYVDSAAGSPGGSDTQIQYNNAGAFGGDSGFTTDGAGALSLTGTLGITGSATVDNLSFNGNAITSTNTNGDIDLLPDGTGAVSIGNSLYYNASTGTTGFTYNSGGDSIAAVTGSTTRATFNSSGFTLATGTSVNEISTDTTMASASNNNLYTGLALKTYIDATSSGFTYVQPVRVASPTNFAATYNNGTAGVGATLTADANGAASVDGISLSVNDRVIFPNQTDQTENGVYTLTTNGDGSNPSIYTRATDFDEPAEMQAGTVIGTEDESGASLANTLWLLLDTITTIGTDDLVFNNYGSTVNAGGSNTQIQYNAGGVLAGDSGFTTDGSGVLTVTGSVTVDNLEINGNSITAQDTNGDLNLAADGSGDINVSDNIVFSSGFACGLRYQDLGGGVDQVSIFADAVNWVKVTFEGLEVGNTGIRVQGILDQDTMSSDSAIALCTQQSIKAYVDNSVASLVDSVTGTANEIDVDNTDAENPVISLPSTLVAPGTARVGNILLDTNTISSQDTNGDLILAADGAGDITVTDRVVFESSATNSTGFEYNSGAGVLYCNVDAFAQWNVNSDGFQIKNANARVQAILDQDDMASDSDIAICTQQSIKAYVDNSIASSGSAITWNTETGSSATMVRNNGYICDSSFSVDLTLPATAAVGTQILIVGINSGGWQVSQNAGQSIQIGEETSTVGAVGTLTSISPSCGLHLICVEADTKWANVSAPQGEISVL